jgi:hypothetical protein
MPFRNVSREKRSSNKTIGTFTEGLHYDVLFVVRGHIPVAFRPLMYLMTEELFDV